MSGGLNTTGLPNTADYNLGRGIIYVSTLLNGLPDASGWRDLGNAPEFSVSNEVETLEHQSSRQGLKITDKEVTISQKINLAFTLDEINFQNLALLFSGTALSEPTVNPAIAGFGPIDQTTAVVLGRHYDITSLAGQTGVRAYDIATANLTLNETSGAPVLMVEGTDYTVDEKNGRVFILSTAVNIVAGEPFSVTLAADAGAENVDEVRALTQTTVTVALKFISENPANNDQQTEYKFHQVGLKAEGDFALIGDEFTTMGFTAVAESQPLADADSPVLTVRRHLNS